MKGRITISLLFLLLGAGTGLLYLCLPFADVSYPLDDAWIHMVYARNLAEGHFFSYNPFQTEAGFTSPLWLLITAGSHLFSESVLVPKTAGWVFLILLAIVARRLGGTPAGLLVLLDPMHQFAAMSGMEVTLFSFLCLLALERRLAGRPGQAGWAAAGALLARPEGAILFILLPAMDLAGKDPLLTRMKRWLWLMFPSLAAALLWMAFCYHVADRPFPNTFYAKMGSPFLCAVQSPFKLYYDFLALESPLFPVIVTMLAFFALRFSPGRRTAALLLFSCLLFIGVWATRPILMVESFYWQRYLLPSLAGFHVLAGIGLKSLWSRAAPGKALAFYCSLGVLIGYGIQFDAQRDLYERNCRDISRFNVAAGQWIAGNTDPEDRVAVLDAGALRYFGNRRIIDLGGLNTGTLSDLSRLEGKLDVGDPMSLAVYSGADWVVLPYRHVFPHHWIAPGKLRLFDMDFICSHEIRYDDYSLYGPPETFLLLFLKKARRK